MDCVDWLGARLLDGANGGGAEIFGGIFILLGWLTRPASFVLAITMLVAIFAVHINNGLFMANNGYEYGLTLLAVSLSLLWSGAGALSIDRMLSQKLSQ